MTTKKILRHPEVRTICCIVVFAAVGDEYLSPAPSRMALRRRIRQDIIALAHASPRERGFIKG
jgi:hypothetical protein